MEKSVSLRVISLVDIILSLTNSENMKIVVHSLFNSLPQIYKLVLIEVIIFFMLGVINIKFFKGNLYSCT